MDPIIVSCKKCDEKTPHKIEGDKLICKVCGTVKD